ncbi:MAG: hypothetical protein JSU01_03420 [Bacteroidetes bacterium]|nr:hypothetical protein [Bacteroidota bacterium]
MRLEKQLSGGDLRSIGNVDEVMSQIKSQPEFDELFRLLFSKDRLIVMRAADAIEKITIKKPQYLSGHEDSIFELCKNAADKELQWHLALLLPRLKLKGQGLLRARAILYKWLTDRSNSRIVRVNALQAIFGLADEKSSLQLLFSGLEQEAIPSINARIQRLKKQMARHVL